MKHITGIISIIIFFTLSSIGTQLSSQPVLEWSAAYDSGSARAIAVDNTGNVFVIGIRPYFYDDILTLKFSRHGELKWYAIHDGYLNAFDEPVDLEVDNAGNVYVLGTEENFIGYGIQMVLIKYGINGVPIWTRTYSLGDNQYADDMVMDKDGNIVCVGSAIGPNFTYDYTTVKYDSSGNLLWARNYDRGSLDNARSVTTDEPGNIYVTGYVFDPTEGFNYATVKYGQDGTQQWVAEYNGVGDTTDYARSVSVDESGNVYVTGESLDASLVPNPVTVKYNNNGELQWVVRENGRGGSGLVRAIHTNGVCIADRVIGISGNLETNVIRYNEKGEELWSNSSKEFNEFTMEYDRHRSLYLAGTFINWETGNDIKTFKLDISGRLMWEVTYAGKSSESVIDIATDNDGSVYVCGDNPKILILKYRQVSRQDETVIERTNDQELLQNFPNPFNPSTVISYNLAEPSLVRLEVFDILGRSVAVLANGEIEAGVHNAVFDGSNLSGGIYFYRLQVGASSSENNSASIMTKSMLLLK